MAILSTPAKATQAASGKRQIAASESSRAKRAMVTRVTSPWRERVTLCAVAVVVADAALNQRPVQAYEAARCAVINIEPGGAHWDCQYNSVEERVPNVLFGNRGFWNPKTRRSKSFLT